MNFFDLIASFGSETGARVRYGVDIPQGVNAIVEPQNLTVLYTCVKILSDNFSRLNLRVKDAKGKEKTHPVTKLWNSKPNNFTNPQTLRSVSEWDRNTTGNSFFYIQGTNIIHIPATLVCDYYIESGKLHYKILPNSDTHREWDLPETIPAEKMLHFKGVTGDGIFGLSPLTAAHATHQLMQNASTTVNNFYKNGTLSNFALVTDAPTMESYKSAVADRKEFDITNTGIQNAGRVIQLPTNHKLTPLGVKFVDAELINTMKFSRDSITSLYNVPNYMLSENDSNLNIEQQTRAFVNQTMSNIANIYGQEIAFKMLPEGWTCEFELDNLIDTTFSEKVTAYKDALQSGLISPNEAARKLGFEEITGEYGDYKYLQAQMVPLEKYEQYNPLQKDSTHPTKQLKDNNLKPNPENIKDE